MRGKPKQPWKIVYGKDAQLLRVFYTLASAELQRSHSFDGTASRTKIKIAVRAVMRHGLEVAEGISLFRCSPSDISEADLVIHSAIYSPYLFRPIVRRGDGKFLRREYHVRIQGSGKSDRDYVRDARNKRRQYLEGLIVAELQAALGDGAEAAERRLVIERLCTLDSLEIDARRSAEALGRVPVQAAITKAVRSIRKAILFSTMPDVEITITDLDKAIKSVLRIAQSDPEVAEILDEAIRRVALRRALAEEDLGSATSLVSVRSEPKLEAEARITDRCLQDAKRSHHFLTALTEH